MTYKELEALHTELDYKYENELPSLNAFKTAKREGRLSCKDSFSRQAFASATIVGKNEGTWEVTEADMEIDEYDYC